ncbi:MAG: ABC transporter substrate binding protein, partial [Bradyrhizobium sp.]
MRRIGVLNPFAENDPEARTENRAFRDALRKLGWLEGHNISIDYRWAAGDVGRISTYAKELVGLAPDLIVARSTPVTGSLLHETSTIPIVFVGVSDPVGSGFVGSMARPGG